MVKFGIVGAVFFAGLIWYFVSDYQSKMILVDSYRTWASVVRVREKEINIPRVGGSYLNWVAYIHLSNGKILPVQVSVSPIPKIGDCMPVLVSEYKEGGVLALLDQESWRMDGSKVSAANCDSFSG